MPSFPFLIIFFQLGAKSGKDYSLYPDYPEEYENSDKGALPTNIVLPTPESESEGEAGSDYSDDAASGSDYGWVGTFIK